MTDNTKLTSRKSNQSRIQHQALEAVSLNPRYAKTLNMVPYSLTYHGIVLWQASIFHFGSISLIAEPCRSAHLTAMLEAKNAGALLSYDPNLRLALWPSADEAKAQMLSIWDQVNIVKISDTELEFLTGKSSVEDDIVMSLWKPAMKLLVVTLGKDGCKYYTKNFLGTVDSIKVKPVDTTGAGDAFVGAMLWGIAKDLSTLKDEKKLKEVLRFANACGAITTTKKGAVPGLPSEAEVLEFLKKA
ncbi:putative fructokinase-8 [Phalaenopsis equestris]|uniref:putative fructokinase-8 n=1 Tax=Phalaenopsis equestris TaxID=78828 RepID=UPI0009E5B57F|nr:putative fructokinase-8 [Phalaenopsis equestris]